MNKKHKTLKERISFFIAQSPDKAVLLLILFFNITFFLIAAAIISRLAPSTLKEHGFWASVFYTVTMILDAGCISFVVEDVGQTGVGVIIICLMIVLIGMITFTGAVIGYITNYISSFIESSNAGKRPLKVSGHTVLLNWNSRAAEIVNDLIFSEDHEDIVILVKENKEDIQEELNNRIVDTINEYNRAVREEAKKKHSSVVNRWLYCYRHVIHNNLSIVVREGDVLSKAQLDDICVERAKTIFILGRDYKSEYKKYANQELQDQNHVRGNSNVVKVLILVADITSNEASADNQKIVVEIEDSWTYGLVQQIIEHKERLSKCNIVPVPINRILGQLMSQLCVMPQLNQIYAELFSNKGFFFASDFLTEDYSLQNANDYIKDYMDKHQRVLPLSVMETKEGTNCFYLCEQIKNLEEAECKMPDLSFKVELNPDFHLHQKNIIILGHNSGMKSLMEGFNAFRNEWDNPDGSCILDIMIIDDHTSLERHNYYKEYPYVSKYIEADIYDKERIYAAITDFSQTHVGDIAVLILSDDQVPNEEVDERPLAFMIYIDSMFQKMKEENEDFDDSIYEIIVEILNPQNFEAVRSYGSNHIVVSNKYISHMMTQIGEHSAIYEFYQDILTYDECNLTGYESKEFYLKDAQDFFVTLPPRCKASELVRAVFEAGPDDNKSVLLGVIKRADNQYTLFAGDNYHLEVELDPRDRLILCSNH